MKKYIKNILLLFTATIFIVSCDERELTVLDPATSTTASLSTNEVVLNKDLLDENALITNWTVPDPGYEAATTYEVIITYGELFKSFNVGDNYSKEFTNDQLNKVLIGLGVEPELPTIVDVHVNIVLSAYKSIPSNTVQLTATAYSDSFDLSTEWGVVGSAAVNGWDGPDMPFFLTSDPNVLVAYVTLITGEMKFRTNNSWDLNYGDNGNDGTLDEGGDNIPVTAGTYKILFNISDFTYTKELYTWGLVGDATPNSWDGPDMPLAYDSYSDTWKAIVTLGTGEFKFRLNNTWDVDYGDDGNDGTLEPGGANIPVSAGTYEVIMNLKDLEYTIEAINLWGLVGDATPNGWDGPDTKFSRDYSQDGLWILNGMTLTDGNFKFRANDAWDVNYGDDGNDGSLEDGGADIPVTAGTYDFVLDFSDPDAPTYTKTLN